jgi:antitoxin CptB
MSEPEPASLDARRRRLLYRATHRGTYENDILLGGFVRRHIGMMHESELTALEALLELPDNELGDWLTGRSPIPSEADTPMLRRIRDEARTPLSSRAAGEGRGGGGGAGDGTTPPPQPSSAPRERGRNR